MNKVSLLYIKNINLDNCKRLCKKKYLFKNRYHFLIQFNAKINKLYSYKFKNMFKKYLKKYLNNFFKIDIIFHLEDNKNHFHLYIYTNKKINHKHINNIIKLILHKHFKIKGNK